MLEAMAEIIRMFGEFSGYVLILGIGCFIGAIGCMAWKDVFTKR